MTLNEFFNVLQLLRQKELKKNRLFRVTKTISVSYEREPKPHYLFKIQGEESVSVDDVSGSVYVKVKKIVEEIDSTGCIRKFEYSCACGNPVCTVSGILTTLALKV